MKQLLVISKREIFTRLRTKEFYLIAIISPWLFLTPIIFNIFDKGNKNDNNEFLIGIKSEINFIENDTTYFRGIRFFSIDEDISEFLKKNNGVIGVLDVKNRYLEGKTSLRLYIREDDLLKFNDNTKIVQAFINNKLVKIKSETLSLVKTDVLKLSNLKVVSPILLKNNSTDKLNLAKILSFIVGMLFYITTILFNNNIARSILEEKSNKLVEVLSIFIKPRTIILGKIIGQSFIFFIQIILWIFCFFVYAKILSFIESSYSNSENSVAYLESAFLSLKEMKLLKTGLLIVLFFILGFLFNGLMVVLITIYSAGKRSSIMFLSNLANIISIYLAFFSVSNNENKIVEISYYIPFFSYLTVPSTLPFNKVQDVTIILSLAILVVSIYLLFKLITRMYEKNL